MSAIEVQHYLGRARDLAAGMLLLQEDLSAYRYSSALLGVHSAISYSDALRTGLGGKQLSSEDHKTAANELRKLLSSSKFESETGLRRLEILLKNKGKIAYSDAFTGDTEIKKILLTAERFVLWAEDTGKRLGIEGWNDDSN